MLSAAYEEALKKGFTDSVINEINTILINYNGRVMLPFYIHPPDVSLFNYYLIEDLDAFTEYKDLEALVTKLFTEFAGGDHLCALLDGKNLKSVKFYIGKGMFSLTEALEYKDTVGINHLIYSSVIDDTFNISNGEILLTSK